MKTVEAVETATAISSYGSFIFDIVAGDVICDNMDKDWGYIPDRVDVAEWHRFYPNETMKDGDEYDVLDLGAWLIDTVTGKVVYEAPERSWRIERKRSIKRGEN